MEGPESNHTRPRGVGTSGWGSLSGRPGSTARRAIPTTPALVSPSDPRSPGRLLGGKGLLKIEESGIQSTRSQEELKQLP